jgi:D-3-phosphoglycerate dehydrogenase / 2-oxoglutarate reductase
MPKVLIADAMSEQAAKILAARGIDVEVTVGLKPEDLLARIGEFDGLAVRSATKVTSKVIEAGRRLRVVGRAGIGVDNIDVAAATRRGIVVMNTPMGNAITTAEHALAMMFALARQIPAADRSTQTGKWEKTRFLGTELFGKSIGLIGCGNIGSLVAERAHALKMKVLGYDPYLSGERALALGIEKVELAELWRRSDVISLHTPLTEQTRNIIDKAALAQMKKGVLVINCARGGLVVESDLAAALDSGHVAGAALDVFETEPARASPLFGRDNVVTTPHLGAATIEAQEKVALQLAEQMADFLCKGAISNAVNMPSLTAEEAAVLAPYLRLARQLGAFAGQLTKGPIRAVRMEYAGHAAGLNVRPLTGLMLAGVLAPALESVNMVSAPTIAREYGIDVMETKLDRASDYLTLVRLAVVTESNERSVAGTLMHGNRPRVVEIKGISMEAELGPHMLYVTNRDKPGFIGSLGRALGDAGVNIATFNLGRSAPGGDAIALVEVDQAIGDELLAKVRAIPNVVQATTLSFDR